MPLATASVGGVVLCGGKSSRMGRAKALLEFGDEVLLQRIIRILAGVVDPIVVVAAQDQELPLLPREIIVCRDEFPSLGPLSGIYSGLKQLHQLQIDFGFVTSCDCPFLQSAFVQLLISMLNRKIEIVLPDDGKYCHVLAAIYRTQVFERALTRLTEDRLRPIGLTEDCPTQKLGIDEIKQADPELLSFVNLNTPDDYELALKRFNKLEN